MESLSLLEADHFGGEVHEGYRNRIGRMNETTWMPVCGFFLRNFELCSYNISCNRLRKITYVYSRIKTRYSGQGDFPSPSAPALVDFREGLIQMMPSLS